MSFDLRHQGLDFEKSPDLPFQLFLVAQLALPNDSDSESTGSEFCLLLGIARSISFNFRLPKRPVGAWQGEKLAVAMPVPEATMNKDSPAST